MQKSTKDTTLDVGGDRLVLHVNPSKYHLDLDLPFDVDNEICGAQYNRKTKVGTLGMDVMKPQTLKTQTVDLKNSDPLGVSKTQTQKTKTLCSWILNFETTQRFQGFASDVQVFVTADTKTQVTPK